MELFVKLLAQGGETGVLTPEEEVFRLLRTGMRLGEEHHMWSDSWRV
jgi:hypothetical protein